MAGDTCLALVPVSAISALRIHSARTNRAMQYRLSDLRTGHSNGVNGDGPETPPGGSAPQETGQTHSSQASVSIDDTRITPLVHIPARLTANPRIRRIIFHIKLLALRRCNLCPWQCFSLDICDHSV